MALIPFDQQPDEARLWIFAADRELAAEERGRLLENTDRFLEEWTAHREDLAASKDLREGRFLFVAVDETKVTASGCSIDALVRFLKTQGGDLGVSMVDNAPVLYRENGDIRRVSREEFAHRVGRGEITPETIVFNNTLTSVGQLRAARWEVPARESWHGTAFFG